ncbi:radical SAM protein [Planctomycetota bacterium]
MNDAEGTGQDSILSYSDCRLCPRMCGISRDKGEKGFCGAGDQPIISSAFPHRGEESVLSGSSGSGTIFFCGCNLKCVFCQNYDISSSTEHGNPVSIEKCVNIMLSLQTHGCHNINFVTPTHFTPTIVRAVKEARARGLTVPTVYNCGGYEDPNVLAELEPYIDIYMPDMKFLDSERSRIFLHAPDYPSAVKEAVSIMDRQKGALEVKGSLAVQGLLIRHLVMPGGYEDSKQIIDFISAELSSGTFVNIMGQYRPCHKAVNFKEIADYPVHAEISDLKEYAEGKGLRVSD